MLFFSSYINKSINDYYFIKNNSIWSSNLNNTTWKYDNGWAGENYVFYTDKDGNKKCIHQILGSGVYVAGTDYPEFKILGSNKFKIGNDIFEYRDNKLISKDKVLTFYENKPIVGYRLGYVDINLIKNTKSIEELNFLTSNGPGFQVYLIDKIIDFPPYESFDESHRNNFLNKSKLGTLLFTDKDIENYDWSDQTITLNLDASKKYQKEYGEYKKLLDKRHSSGYDKSMKWDESLLDKNVFNELQEFEKTTLVERNHFIVVLNGKRLFAGRLVSFISAEAVRYPVMYTSLEMGIGFNNASNGKVQLKFGSHGFGGEKIDFWKLIKFPETKDYFMSQNKLIKNFTGTFLESSGGYGLVDNAFIPNFREKGFEKYLNKEIEGSGLLSIEKGCEEDNVNGNYIHCFKGERELIENPQIKLYEYKLNYTKSPYENDELKVLNMGKEAIINKFGEEAFISQMPFQAKNTITKKSVENGIIQYESFDTNWYMYGTVYENIDGKKVKKETKKETYKSGWYEEEFERGGGNLTVEFTKDLKVSNVYYNR